MRDNEEGEDFVFYVFYNLLKRLGISIAHAPAKQGSTRTPPDNPSVGWDPER